MLTPLLLHCSLLHDRLHKKWKMKNEQATLETSNIEPSVVPSLNINENKHLAMPTLLSVVASAVGVIEMTR